jgi:hypothetical protein
MAFAKGQHFFKLAFVNAALHSIADQLVKADLFLLR